MSPSWIAVAIVFVGTLALGALALRLRRKAQVEREAEIALLQVRPLDAAALRRHLDAWSSLQSRFDVEPEATIRNADHLLQEIMRARGYPTGDFGRAEQTLSAEQADLLHAYRTAHRISVKAETDSISADEVQRAKTALRAVFDGLTSS